jgi:hypothetical protein
MKDFDRFNSLSAANDGPAAQASRPMRARERTVPILDTMHPVPGYPAKLVVFKMAASRFWQVRCWMQGRSYRRSTRTESLRLALNAAKLFYDELIRQHSAGGSPQQPLLPGVAELAAPADSRVAGSTRAPCKRVFRGLAEQLMRHEMARTRRRELSAGTWQVMRNRLDAHILPRWADTPVDAIDHQDLLEFTEHLSERFSTTTVSQYLVLVRKVLAYAQAQGLIDKLPVFPRVKVHSTPRGAFTPSEYWQIIRCARRLRGQEFPLSGDQIRERYKIRRAEQIMPPDLAWAISFMVSSFIRPSDLKTLQHRHVEVVHSSYRYLRLTLPETKRHDKPIVTLQQAVRLYRLMRQSQQAAGYGKPDDYLFLPHLRDRNYAHWVPTVSRAASTACAIRPSPFACCMAKASTC